jgi:hypothetical protein
VANVTRATTLESLDEQVLHAGQAEFRSGWFVESLATQTLVVFVIRTRRIPFFHSRPSLAMLITPPTCALAGAVLPFTPLAGLLGFTTLPVGFFLILLGMIVTYLLLVEVAKRRFYAVQPHPRRPRPTPQQRHQRQVRRRAARFIHYPLHLPADQPTPVTSAIHPTLRAALRSPRQRRPTGAAPPLPYRLQTSGIGWLVAAAALAAPDRLVGCLEPRQLRHRLGGDDRPPAAAVRGGTPEQLGWLGHAVAAGRHPHRNPHWGAVRAPSPPAGAPGALAQHRQGVGMYGRWPGSGIVRVVLIMGEIGLGECEAGTDSSNHVGANAHDLLRSRHAVATLA